MSKWWESAPVAEDAPSSRRDGNNWWKAAPVAERQGGAAGSSSNWWESAPAEGSPDHLRSLSPREYTEYLSGGASMSAAPEGFDNAARRHGQDLKTSLRSAWPGLRETMLNAARDPVSAASGALKMVTDPVGSINEMASGGDPTTRVRREVAESIQASADEAGRERMAIRDQLSPEAQALDKEIARRYEDEGFFSGFMHQLRNPSSIARLVTESAPATGTAILGGGLGLRGLLASTMTMGAGESMSELRRDIMQAKPEDLAQSPAYRAAIEAGASDREAREAVFEEVRGTAGMIGAAAGTIPAIVGLNPVENVLRRDITGAVASQATRGPLRQAMSRLADSRAGRAAREAIGEVPEELGIDFGANVAQERAGLDVDYTEGMAQTIGSSLLAGGAMGALTPGGRGPIREGHDLLGGENVQSAMAEAMRRQNDAGRDQPEAAAPPVPDADLDAALTRNVPELTPVEGDPFASYADLDAQFDDAGQASVEADPVAAAASEAATSPTNDLPAPTEAQKEAGNYKKGSVSLHGLRISIENPAGSERSGTDADGNPWSTTMQSHYGYIRGTKGKDGDHIDVFVGPQAADPSLPVFVVDQIDPQTGRFDEAKVMLGFDSEQAARDGYLANYDQDWQGLGGITQMSLAEFKDWSRRPRKSKQPLSDAVREQETEAALEDAVDAALNAALKKGQGALFSRPETTVRGDNPVSAGWTLLAGNDAAFQLPTSKARDLEGIVKDKMPEGFKINDASELIDQTDWDDGGPADRAWRMTTPKGSKATIYERKGVVWIDVSDLKMGEDGKRIYNAVTNYAHNADKVFIGDPAGLSDTAVYRRLEMMLSSALKFGTTRHLWPHARQVTGEPKLGVPGLNWKDGDDAHNIRELLTASYQAIRAQAPEIADMTYNPDRARFERTDGSEVTDAGFDALAKAARNRRRQSAGEARARFLAGRGIRGDSVLGSEPGGFAPSDGYASGVGRTTLKRAVLTHALLSGEGAARSKLLAHLGGQRGSRDLLAPPLREILYSVAGEQAPQLRFLANGPASGVSPTRLRAIVTDIRKRWTGAEPDVVVLDNAEGLPDWVKSDPDYRFAQGFYDPRTETAYLVASNLDSMSHARRVLTHEVVGHYGIEAIAGPDTWAWVAKRVAAMRSDPRHKALLEDIDSRYDRNDPAYLKEVVAVMAERGIGTSILDRLGAAIRRFLARLGLWSPASEDAIRQLIVSAARHVERQAEVDVAQGDPSPVFSRRGTTVPVTADDSAVGKQRDRAAGGETRRDAKRDDATGLPLNEDGTVTVYHHTSAANAEQIKRTGTLRSAAEPDVYVTTHADTDTGYGDTAVAIRVDPARLEIDDEFPGGRRDFRLNVGSPGGQIRIDLQNDQAASVDADASSQPASEAGANTETEVEQARKAWQEQGTDSPWFKRWFGDSKVVDAEGRPLVVYHGTPDGRFLDGDAIFKSERDRFGGTMGRSEAAHWFASSREMAASYADESRAFDYQNAEPGIVAAYLKMENPLVVNAAGKEWREAQQRGKTSDVIEQAREGGHDGVIIRNVRDNYNNNARTRPGDTYVVFEPAQIKSATGNRGTFDPENPSILFSKPAGTRQHTPAQLGFLTKAGLKPDTRTRLQKLRDAAKGQAERIVENLRDRDALKLAIFDRFHGVRAAYEASGQTDILGMEGYVSARLSTGLPAVMESVMMHGAPEWRDGILSVKPGTKGLLQALAPVKDSVDDWLGWMVARRAQVLKRQGREKLMSDADIAAGLSLAAGREDAFRRAAMDYLAVKNAILDVAEQAGLIDPQKRAVWDHAEYIPFYRDDVDSIGPGTRQGLAGQSSGILTLRGGDSALADPLGNIVRNFTRLIDASLKNNAMLEIRRDLPTFFEKIPGSEFKQAVVPLSQIRKHLLEAGVDQAVVDAMPEQALKGFEKFWAIEPPAADDVVRIMDGGQPTYYRVEDPLLLRSLTAFKPRNPGWFMKPMIWAKRILTAGATGTVEFVAANFIRDSLEGFMVADDRLRPVVDSMRGALNALKSDERTRELMMSGAYFAHGHIYGHDTDATAAALRRSLRAHGVANKDLESFIGTIARGPSWLWDRWTHLQSSIEHGTRRAMQDAAIREGRTRKQAAFSAKDLLDFSMRGDSEFVAFFTDTIPFLNARLQGLYKLGRSWHRNRKQMALRGGTLVVASLALLAWNLLAHQDGYDELEEWDRDMYWHIGPGTSYHVRIPKPFELGLVFGTAPERGARALLNLAGSSSGESLRQTWMSVLHAVSETLAVNPIPQALLPIAEQVANRSFFTGRMIENQGDQRLLPEARAEWYTSATMQLAPAWFSNATGMSPKRLEHLWRGYTAGLGDYAMRMSDWLVRVAQDAPSRPAMAIRDVPLAGRFVRGDDPPRSTSYQTEFYRLKQEAEEVEGTVKEYLARASTEGRPDLQQRAMALYESNASLLGPSSFRRGAKANLTFGIPAYLRRVQDQISSIRAQEQRIALNREMSPREKRDRINELTRQRNDLLRETVLLLKGQDDQRPSSAPN